MDEIQGLDWEVRAWWIGELGKAGGAEGWFNNVQAIVRGFGATPEFGDLKGWASAADAGLLWAIQDGFRANRDKHEASTTAGGLWLVFFTEGTGDFGRAAGNWGRAEQAGTNLGIAYADMKVGHLTGLAGDEITVFIGWGNLYRCIMTKGGIEGQVDPREGGFVKTGMDWAFATGRAIYYQKTISAAQSWNNPSRWTSPFPMQ